jgi:hypothetical protein
MPNFTPTQDGVSQTDREGSINFNAYREGILCAYDWRNAKILYTNVESIFGADVDRVARALARLRDSERLTSTQEERLTRNASDGDAPSVGVEHLQKLLSFDNNAGLDYLFSRARLDPHIIAPAGRLGWLI